MARTKTASHTHEIPARKKRKGQASSDPPPSDSESDEQETPQAAAAIRLDRQRFLTKSKQQRYLELEPRQIVTERRVELNAGESDEFNNEIKRRKWTKLATPEKKYSEEIIREFYANALPLQNRDQTRKSWVRGTQVYYHRDAINDFLGNPYSLGGDGRDGYGRLKNACSFKADEVAERLCLPGCTYTLGASGKPVKILRKNLNTLARIWQNFLYCNVFPTMHISDLTMPRATLLYSIMNKTGVDVATIISNEIHRVVLSTPSPTGVSKPLGFPGLIMGLCRAARATVPSHLSKTIRPPINASYIKTHCKNAQQGSTSQPGSQRHGQASSSSQVASSAFLAAHFHHIEQQNLANHLALMSINTSLYHAHQQQFYGGPLFQWPSPETFQQQFQWPGDSPNFPGEEEQFEQEEEAENEDGGEDD
uniref:Putative plant transposon protein domain-containing protein n=1 Tax=Cajanus cajan TaxID=3821 RepID=A0A151RWE9_CAJCA|nr:hypothetical protein KK1_031521 [Cajanus cajan]